MKGKQSRPYLGFLKEYAFRKKLLPSYILTIAIIVLTAGVSLVRPELQGKVIDDLGNPHSTSLSAFMFLLAVFLGMLLLNYLMNYVQRYVVAVISEEIAADMRQKVEDKLSTVSVNFFEKIKLSDILLKVDKDVSAVKQCGITSIITLVSNMVILVVVPPYMFSIHKGIAVSNIILLVSVPFITLELTEQLKGYIDEIDFSTMHMFGTPEKEKQLVEHIEMCQQAGIKVVLSFIYEKTNEADMYKLIDIAAKYDTDVLFNIVSPVGRAKDNSEILTDTERIDMNLKILNYMLGKGYENKKIARGFHQRIQVRDSCGGYGKVMAIYPEGDIYMCQCMEKCQFKMGNIIKDTPQKILVRLEEMMNTEEIKKTFCVTYKEICRECDYRYICGGRCLASDEPYDYRCIFIKSMLKYVLFYYNAKEDKRKQLEHYKQYLEQVKEIINQEKKE